MLRQRSRPHTALVLVLSILCAILIALGLFLFLRNLNGSSGEVKSAFLVEGLDPAAQTGTPPGAPWNEKSPGENLFGYRVSSTVTFQSDGTGGGLNVQNPAFNEYLMVVELTADGDESVLYRSQYIAPNQYISKVDLREPLAPGEHEGTVYLSAVDPKTLDVVGVLENPILIKVK